MISIELDDRAVLAALAQLRDHARDLAPAFREIGSSLVDEIKLGFAEGRSPYGAPWKPLSPATQAANKGRRLGGQPLRDTGKLMGSIAPTPGAAASVFLRALTCQSRAVPPSCRMRGAIRSSRSCGITSRRADPRPLTFVT